MKSYHDTTQAVDLQEREKKAKSQEKQILRIFEYRGKHEGFTPRRIHRFMISEIDPFIELQCVKRAITNLTKADKLIKTENKVLECKGAYNYLWKLNK